MIIVCAVVAIVLMVGGFWIADDEYGFKEALGMISVVIGALIAVVVLIMIFAAIIRNINPEAQLVGKEQIYTSLTYQLDNDIYDNDNDLGKKELYDQIQEWNVSVAKGKIRQRDFWVGCFTPNIYDDLELIEYGGEN